MSASRATAARCLLALAATLLLAACTIPRLKAPPGDATEAIEMLGIPNARFWVDRDAEPLMREMIQQANREAALAPPDSAGQRSSATYLAISGGGDNGAFGAGLLVGWSAAGTRPVFDIVTGISTGALAAPFAFLGREYDVQLRSVFTDVAPPDILRVPRLLAGALFGEALADTTPLYSLISQHANAAMLAAIAAEYKKGRLLLIGTTNLDVQRPVLWNIGAIAASGHPEALALFRKILLASSAIPGAFPPVMIDVEVAGRKHQEMHVDGGNAAQLFLYPPSLDLGRRSRELGFNRDRTAYIIRNARLDPEWASTDRRFLSIASRSMSAMIHFSGLNDVVRVFLTSSRDGLQFRLAYIGADFQQTRSEPFETAFMRALFDYGYARGRSGNAWSNAPPGFADPPPR